MASTRYVLRSSRFLARPGYLTASIATGSASTVSMTPAPPPYSAVCPAAAGSDTASRECAPPRRGRRGRPRARCPRPPPPPVPGDPPRAGQQDQGERDDPGGGGGGGG